MTADVVVVGAGITGAASAYALAKAGLSVTLVERYAPAAMASGWTLAGVRQSGRHPAELPLAQAAVALWSGLDRELGAATGYAREGNLRLARTEAELPVIEALVEAQRALGLDIRLLRGREVQEAAPALAPGIPAASLCLSDGYADPAATSAAYMAALARLGVTVLLRRRVLAITTQAGRVTGVATDAGPIAAGAVVVAAGAFGNELLAPLGLAVPLDIHMVTVMRSLPGARVLHQVLGVANADLAVRQEPDGRFRATSGVEPWHGTLAEAGGSPVVPPVARTLGQIVEKVGAVLPAFHDSLIEAFWAGLIDLTPDALPVIDAPGPAGLVVAMGFSGHGYCLGPVSGQIVAALVQGQVPDLPIEAFRHARFGALPARGERVTLHG